MGKVHAGIVACTFCVLPDIYTRNCIKMNRNLSSDDKTLENKRICINTNGSKTIIIKK